MKSSYYRLFLKPTQPQVSKKNSAINSINCKEVGEATQQQKETKVATRRDKPSRHSNNSIHERESNLKTCNQQIKTKATSKINSREKNIKEQSLPFNKIINKIEGEKQMQPISILGGKKSIKNVIGLNEEPCNHNVDRNVELVAKTCKKSFHYHYIIGKGGFGKVWKIEHVKNRNQYAMKEMLKSLVMTKKSVQSIMNERYLLSTLSSPFIVNIHYAFQDRDTLYLVLDLLEGGDLRHHISTKKFSELQAKFFICCIVLGLEYLHNHKIIHRDIKPENLVLDSRGYVRITDLGIARIKKTNNSSDTSGTPGYMSPEVICRQNHGYVSDFYALGIIAYELATGKVYYYLTKRPHNGVTRNEIREEILSKQACIKKSDIPSDWSDDSIDFINRLLQRKPEQRLGFHHGAEELKNHPWIKDLNWEKLFRRDIESPYVPIMKKSDFDQDEQITIEDEEEREIIEKNAFLLRKPEFQELFKEYYFEANANILCEKQRNSNTQLLNPKIGSSLVHSKPVTEVAAKRKDSYGSYTGQASVKNSSVNLKKSMMSTNISTDVTAASLSGALKNMIRTPETSFRNMSGNIHKKSNAGIRSSKENILNVSECENAYGLIPMNPKEKEKCKDRPFFRN